MGKIRRDIVSDFLVVLRGDTPKQQQEGKTDFVWRCIYPGHRDTKQYTGFCVW